MAEMQVSIDGNAAGITSASSARTASGDSGLIALTGKPKYISVTLNITAVSGVSPTVIWYIRHADSNGVEVDLFTRIAAAAPVANTQYRFTFGPDCPSVAITTPTAAGVVVPVSAPVVLDPRGSIRLGWTLAGTTPSVTFQYAIQQVQ